MVGAVAGTTLWLSHDQNDQHRKAAGPNLITDAPERTPPGPGWKDAPLELPGGWIVTGATSSDEDSEPVGLVFDRSRGRYLQVDEYDMVWAAPRGNLAAVWDGDRAREIGLLDLGTRAVKWVSTGIRFGDVQWSPDGSRVLLTLFDKDTGRFSFGILSADGMFRDYEVDRQRYLCTDYCAFTWLPDGQEVALPQTDLGAPRSEAEPHLRRGLQLFSADGGQPTRLIPVRGDVAGPAAWSPDGRTVVISGQKRLPLLVEVADGRIVRDLPTADVVWVSDDRLCYLDGPRSNAILIDRNGRELDRQPLPKELAFLKISVAPR
ncbi:hypothetical protein GCM10027290_33740 [Micromonospora sonneratiae]